MTKSSSLLARFILPATAMLIITTIGCSKKTDPPKGRPPALVVITKVSQQDVPVQLKSIGTMVASESVAVRTQISGELVKVAFKEGQEVQKGALLFQLDPRNYQAVMRKAEATLSRDRAILANALRDHERYSQLLKDGIVTHEQAEGYRTKAESAAASSPAYRRTSATVTASILATASSTPGTRS